MPSKIAENNKKHVLGVQANIWTEYIGSSNKVEFTVLPRVLALSKLLDTAREKELEKFLRTTCSKSAG
jgi:hexosaminidase